MQCDCRHKAVSPPAALRDSTIACEGASPADTHLSELPGLEVGDVSRALVRPEHHEKDESHTNNPGTGENLATNTSRNICDAF